MFEVGKTYGTKKRGAWECIAVNETHAWLKRDKNDNAYVWTQDGKAVSLGDEYDIKPQPREFWIGEISRIVSEYEQPGMIHVREVLE